MQKAVNGSGSLVGVAIGVADDEPGRKRLALEGGAA
jgi:hypothetical protein